MEQGADILDRLLHDRVARTPSLKTRLVAAYLIEGLTPVARFTQTPLCRTPDQTGCALSWRSVEENAEGEARRLIRRALTWNDRGALIEAAETPIACVNPVTGSVDAPISQARESRGATNATNLEWGARPALQRRLVEAECRNGILWRSRLTSESFRTPASWADQRKIPAYNLFYADIEADVMRRLKAWEAAED